MSATGHLGDLNSGNGIVSNDDSLFSATVLESYPVVRLNVSSTASYLRTSKQVLRYTGVLSSYTRQEHEDCK